ncbi:hypothetical protein ABVT39_023059 [Epinephelus coioides]
MLFLPAAALCCLCSALVAMAAEQLIQDDLTLTRRVGENVSFTCRTDLCNGSSVVWLQKRDTETFTVILYINRNSGYILKDSYNHPQKDDFSVVYEQNVYEQVVKPVVSVYPAASRAHLEGKSSLLCLASAMFPALVRFSWKRQEENGPLLPAEGEQLELRESGRTAAILLIRQKEIGTYKYRCSVQHQGGTVEAQTQQEVSYFPVVTFQSRVKLLCVLYTVLIVKSLVYCCGLSLLMILRNKGPSTNCTHAD